MMRDPEQKREPWCGSVRLIVTFEVNMDDEDDAPDAESAGTMAKRQLEAALSAAAKCKALSRTPWAVLAGWQDIELVETEDESGLCARPK